MIFDPQIYFIICALTVVYAILLGAAVMFIRFLNKSRGPGDGERRSHPTMRRVINILAMVPIGVISVLALLWGFWLIKNLMG